MSPARPSSFVQILLFLTAVCLATIAQCRPAAHSTQIGTPRSKGFVRTYISPLARSCVLEFHPVALASSNLLVEKLRAETLPWLAVSNGSVAS